MKKVFLLLGLCTILLSINGCDGKSNDPISPEGNPSKKLNVPTQEIFLNGTNVVITKSMSDSTIIFHESDVNDTTKP